ncbi:MAG: hypothetical protein A3F70_06675 [Acidobacteria bacterium RIFCSPLOWO2_12_FULL_67_14]|nr:MAG: hypothetical protein A3H29_09350 [Acidobacteria bacterium RIFCSPLOWO2_02_FULL_67_21]OFW37307.1 MAG: hypothetical protein A3F70_06675 [Acidobacteria bacterium RIFCSPLOWO2_12_FULL_67_14]
MPFQNPVIVIPGITATELIDDYPMTSDTVWSMVLNKEYERVALHPDDLTFEAIEPAHVFPGRAFSIYDDLIRMLRHELSQAADKPTPVFAFPYDWRVDVQATAARLVAFIEEVLKRTALLRYYADAGDGLRVDLVGHSMGGLIISECLLQLGGKAAGKVGKVATIGTPFLGSLEAIVKVATGMSLLTGSTPHEREREAARVTPAVYQLFPSYANAAVEATGGGATVDVDLLNPENMQASILASLAEFVRLYSVKPKDRRTRAQEILEELIAGARAHRERVRKLKPKVDWLAVVGVGQKTRVQMTVTRLRGKPRFEISDSQFVNDLTRDTPASRRTGDGTVPLEGALPPFMSDTQPICVIEQDLGFLELRDRMLVQFGGFHGLLPAVNLVQRLVVRHFFPKYRGPVWGRPVPGTDPTQWAPPIPGLERRDYSALPG